MGAEAGRYGRYGTAIAQVGVGLNITSVNPRMPQAGPTILLVEDDRSLRGSLSQFLQEHGYRTLLAETARQGWELASARRPQLCLLDLNLPDGSGLDLLKKLGDAKLQTRVVVMTAFDLH